MEVTLNPNGWHRKLQKFVFKNPPLYHSLCPYFWFTVFCFIVTVPVPVVSLYKFICWIGAKLMQIFEWSFDTFDEYVCIPFYNATVRDLEADDIMKGFAVNEYYNSDHSGWTEKESQDYRFWTYEYGHIGDTSMKKRKKLEAKFNDWKKLNPDWQSKLIEAKAEARKAYDIKKEKKEQEYLAKLAKEQAETTKRCREYQKNKDKIARAEARRKAFFLAIVKYTKYPAIAIACLIGSAIVGFVGYYVYRAVRWICYLGDVWYFLNIAKWTGIVLGVAAIVAGIVVLIIAIAKKCTISPGDLIWLRKVGRAILWFLTVVGTVFVVIWKGLTYTKPLWIGIGSFFKFIWMFIMNTKDDYCPAINWEDPNAKKKDEEVK